MRWYLVAVRKYAQFGGRTQRKEFWHFILFYVLFGIPVSVVDVALIGSPILGTVYFLAFLIPMIAVAVRRLHDMGRSGRWMLLYAVPVLAWIMNKILSFSGSTSGHLIVVSGSAGIVAIVCLIVLIVFLVRNSQPGDNRYGANPKGAAAPSAEATA